MDNEFFHASQKLFDQELTWWGEQLTGAVERAAREGEKLAKVGQETFERGLQAQSALALDVVKHGQSLMERQAQAVRALFATATQG